VEGEEAIDGDLTGDWHAGQVGKDKDSTKIVVGNKPYYTTSSTVIMRAVNKDGELDPEVISWDTFKDLTLDEAEAKNYAVVVGERGKTAKAIVFTAAAFEAEGKDTFYAVALSDDYRSGGKYRAEFDVYGEGEVVHIVGSTVISEGKVYQFKLNVKDEVALVTKVKVEDADVSIPYSYDLGDKDDDFKIDDGYLIIEDGTIRIADDAVIYELDDGDIDRALAVGDLDGKEVGGGQYVVKDDVIVAMTYEVEAKKEEAETTTYIVTYIDDKTNVKDIMIGTKEYEVHAAAKEFFERYVDVNDAISFELTDAGKIFKVTVYDGDIIVSETT